MPEVSHKRGTRAAFNALVAASQLRDGQIYAIKDEKWAAMATGTNTFFPLSNPPVLPAPVVVQRASVRNDGPIALPVAPTVGNNLLFVYSGQAQTESAYVPAGFLNIKTYTSDAYNSVGLYKKTVKAGETGSYNVSADDNQGAALYEISGLGNIILLGGGVIPSNGVVNSFNPRPTDAEYLAIFGMEVDSDFGVTIDSAAGLTVDYNAGPTGNGTGNHRGLVASGKNATGAITTNAGGKTGAVFGAFLCLGGI